ncbi:MAG: hypothetical protein EAZ23_06210 [Oscillatoriales cyanobacterium]|nr:MAG: hypothetical protein EAZ23_06210 [Oscillatoriales cyanobacterium]
MLRPIFQNNTTVEKISTTIESVIPKILQSSDTAASKGDRAGDLSVSVAEASLRKPSQSKISNW